MKNPNEYQWHNYYKCPQCGHLWEDQWDSQCDDECPECGCRDISPYKSEETQTDLLVVNAHHMTKVRPTPNLYIPVTLTGKQKEIGGLLHSEVRIGNDVHWIEDFWLKGTPNV